MPVKGGSGTGSKKPRTPRRFPPSMAGQCLRYAVMELLGFGHMMSPEMLSAMQAGSRLHRRFQGALAESHTVIAIEAPLKGDALGVSGRMDAIVDTPEGPAAVEYKTVHGEKFQTILREGPSVSHVAQLMLYLDVAQMGHGYLVVECRDTGARQSFRVDRDEAWVAWIRSRVWAARQYQAERRLPDREVSTTCLHCDRWQRCFRTNDRREDAVTAHPTWTPEPGIPVRDFEAVGGF